MVAVGEVDDGGRRPRQAQDVHLAPAHETVSVPVVNRVGHDVALDDEEPVDRAVVLDDVAGGREEALEGVGELEPPLELWGSLRVRGNVLKDEEAGWVLSLVFATKMSGSFPPKTFPAPRGRVTIPAERGGLATS